MNGLVDLWAKGHKPQVRDHEIRSAIKTLNMLETGVQIPAEDISALDGKIMNLIKQKLDEKERKQFAEQMV